MNTFKRCVTTDKEQNNEINGNRRAVEKNKQKDKGKGGTNGISLNEDQTRAVRNSGKEKRQRRYKWNELK